MRERVSEGAGGRDSENTHTCIYIYICIYIHVQPHAHRITSHQYIRLFLVKHPRLLTSCLRRQPAIDGAALVGGEGFHLSLYAEDVILGEGHDAVARAHG